MLMSMSVPRFLAISSTFSLWNFSEGTRADFSVKKNVHIWLSDYLFFSANDFHLMALLLLLTDTGTYHLHVHLCSRLTLSRITYWAFSVNTWFLYAYRANDATLAHKHTFFLFLSFSVKMCLANIQFDIHNANSIIAGSTLCVYKNIHSHSFSGSLTHAMIPITEWQWFLMFACWRQSSRRERKRNGEKKDWCNNKSVESFACKRFIVIFVEVEKV